MNPTNQAMKPFLLCWLSLFPLLPLQAQEFAPIGAEWFYRTDFPGYPFNTNFNLDWPVYETFTVTKDTLVMGRACRLIESEVTFQNLTRQQRSEEVVYSEGDSVFIFRNGDFHLLYNFSAQPGDTIRVLNEPFKGFFAQPYPPISYNTDLIIYNQFAYRVDSVGVLVLGDDSLRIQYVTDLENRNSAFPDTSKVFWGIQDEIDRYLRIPGRIVEGVGSINRLTPFGTSMEFAYYVSVLPESLGCYQDATQSYQFGGFDCDSLRSFVTSDIPPIPLQVQVYPNPFGEDLYVTIQQTGSYQVSCYDALGKQQFTLELSGGGEKHLLATASLAPGFYWLQIVDSQGNTFIYHKISKL